MSGTLFEAGGSFVVIAKIAIARWVVVGGVLAAVGVAGAATKLKRPTTGDACLCTPDAQAPTRSDHGARADRCVGIRVPRRHHAGGLYEQGRTTRRCAVGQHFRRSARWSGLRRRGRRQRRRVGCRRALLRSEVRFELGPLRHAWWTVASDESLAPRARTQRRGRTFAC